MMAGILLFAAGVVGNAFFAAYETAFIGSTAIRVRNQAQTANDASAKRLLRYLDAPDRMITLLLLGSNLSLVTGTMVLTQTLGAVYATALALPVFLLFGDLLPRSMARIQPTAVALRALPVILFFDWLLRPLTAPIAWVSARVIALSGARETDMRHMVTTPSDMRVLVDESADHGTILEEEKEMIHSVMDLQHRLAKEVMVPRIDICALPVTATRKELIEVLRESGHTRVPLFNGTVDRIVGVVSAFAVLTDHDTNPDGPIKRYMKEIMHVPDTMRVGDVLKKMRDTRQRMAIVTDEYGGTDGLITVEDILEEIFGEIHDEHDKDDVRIRKVAENAWVLDARLPLQDASEGIHAEIDDENVETIGGWLMHITGRIPKKGELIKHGRFHIMVLDGGPSYLESLYIEVQGDTPVVAAVPAAAAPSPTPPTKET